MKKLSKIIWTAVICTVVMLSVALCSYAVTDDDNGKWICAWGTGPTDISLNGYDNIVAVLGDVTARTVITPTASGNKIRVRFSNLYGDKNSTLKLNSVTIAKSVTTSTDPDQAKSGIVEDTVMPVTFGGRFEAEIKGGTEIYSDEIYFPVTAMENIAISYYAKDVAEIKTMGLSGGTTFLAFGGDYTREVSMGLTKEIPTNVMNIINSLLPSFSLDLKLAYKIVRVIPCLSGLDVYSDNNAYTVAVVGDSTVANELPLYLAERINNENVSDVGVMGKGIIGNMMLHDGLGLAGRIYGKSLKNRFQYDVLAQQGVKYVFLKMGANDIIHPVCVDNLNNPDYEQPTASQLIEEFEEIIDTCHKAGMKIVIGTITQWKGNTRDYFGTGAKYVRDEAEFQADWNIAKTVNKWIKGETKHYNKYTGSSSYALHDGYVDYANEISWNPEDHDALNPNYTSDGAHPTRELQKIWADSFPISLIGVTTRIGNIKLSSNNKTIYITDGVAGTTSLSVSKVLPDTVPSENQKFTWTSSNTSVATVTSTGNSSCKITAKKNGSVLITCNATDGSGAKALCLVTVKTHASSVEIKADETSVYTRKSIKLSATVLPSTTSNKAVKWTSSNTKVATVDSKGNVQGLSAGTATITCTTEDTVSGVAKKASVKITVVKSVDVLILETNVSAKTIYKGNTYQLSAKVFPVDATFPEVTWKSDNSKIASVKSTGVVTAVAAGTTYITCTSVDNPTAKSRIKITVKVKATAVKISGFSSIYAGSSKTLTAVVSPSDATNKKVTWASSNTKIAKVDTNGVVTALKAGTAVITCTTSDGGFTAKRTITVNPVIKSTKVKLNKTSCSIYGGQQVALVATVLPENTTVKTVTWSSSNTSVAKVSSKGIVTGVKPGKATITCKTKDSSKTAKCVVTVKAVVPTSVKLSKTSVSLKPGATYTLKATVSPSNATNKDLKWTSSDVKTATVSTSGKIKAIKPGKVTIKCTTVSGNKVASCTVTVTKVYVSSIKLNKTSLKMDYGSTYTLKATVSPSNSTNKNVTWSSSNTKVAKVSSTGKITTVGKGTAVITCKPADGGKGKAATCVVEVVKTNVIGIKLNHTSIIIKKGNTYQLTGEVLPSNASTKTVLWTSSDSSIASVNNKGLITAKKAGTCVIRATALDGGYIAECKVQVK